MLIDEDESISIKGTDQPDTITPEEIDQIKNSPIVKSAKFLAEALGDNGYKMVNNEFKQKITFHNNNECDFYISFAQQGLKAGVIVDMYNKQGILVKQINCYFPS